MREDRDTEKDNLIQTDRHIPVDRKKKDKDMTQNEEELYSEIERERKD